MWVKVLIVSLCLFPLYIINNRFTILLSYLLQFDTTLLECIQDVFSVTTAPGTQQNKTGVGIVLQDTILFPEGNGHVSIQPKIRYV